MARRTSRIIREFPLDHFAYVRGSKWFIPEEVELALERDGWRTSDTYGTDYKATPESSGLYLFLLHKTPDYDEAIIAYVGMSTNISRRAYGGHHIKDRLGIPGLWPMVWFKPSPEEGLRVEERRYIGLFDPPYNVVGRKFGIEGIAA